MRKYANCDKYRSTRFTNSPPQTRDNRVPIPILFCSPPVASLIASFQCAKTCVSYKGFRQRVLVGRVSCYGACLRKCASPTPAPRQNRPNAKICTGDYPGADCENMHSAKIILSPYGQQSYATPDWARGHNGHGTIVTSKRKVRRSRQAARLYIYIHISAD